MSKLPRDKQFLDLSDYGRPAAKFIALQLKNTSVTPVQVTIWFIISGLLAIASMIYGLYFLAGFFLILKSILDAADGELSRVKNTPSYTGRYLDSIADIILNLLFLLVIGTLTKWNIGWTLFAFIGVQLQGTLYNYYYVILRNRYQGDTTSRVFETEAPVAMSGESQKTVDIMYRIYDFCYIVFDKTIYWLDPKAQENADLPPWFMTLISTFGLGFQLLIIAIFINLNLITWIIPFFVVSIFAIPLIIGFRRLFLK